VRLTLFEAAVVIDQRVEIRLFELFDLWLHLLDHRALAGFELLELFLEVGHPLAGQDTRVIAGKTAALGVAFLTGMLVKFLALLGQGCIEFLLGADKFLSGRGVLSSCTPPGCRS
jgi:hypothetical protein